MSDEAEFGELIIKTFSENARACGVDINPIIHDERIRALVNRLYDENSSDRSFHICPGKRPELDAFSKRIGLEFENELLCIFVSPEPKYLPALWEAYLQWIHKRADAASIIEWLDSQKY